MKVILSKIPHYKFEKTHSSSPQEPLWHDLVAKHCEITTFQATETLPNLAVK